MNTALHKSDALADLQSLIRVYSSKHHCLALAVVLGEHNQINLQKRFHECPQGVRTLVSVGPYLVVGAL
ncbi:MULTISPECIES: hypothetical protein [unclassified Gordonia (in: high G+C Gram-positive bacteria)]|uniref:hypothetical protein n=1 Tax=unclassified Gordonia (in: high G+C Gram-positive bacteria) TaxID=2657482 RepID=UPI0010F9EE4F|nr:MULTISPECIES: hypothetical protein [unclassified Gordonia (in: high G+C Gram-positive bacteria)]